MARPLDDPIDRLIAAALVGDGRRTLKQLADATGLSVSADKELADRASPPWFHRSSSVCAGSILVRSGHVRVCPRCRN
jgi:hypothetical protein